MADEGQDAQQSEHRWRGRRVQAWLVRALTVVIPLAASVGAGAVMSSVLPTPEGLAEWMSWWALMLTAVTAVMMGTDRLTRRLLPLAALLKLSLIFPDQAPSRFRVAVRAGGTRKLEQKLADVKAKGLEHTPAEAAATVLELASMLNVHDRKTRGHSERVRVFSDLLADELKLAKPDRDRLHWAALLHDVGKLVVPHDILNKAGKPSEEEWAILQSHPLEGERFVEPLSDWLGEWTHAIGQHHEKYDGTGYPRGLAGHDISMAARIVAVADSYEVMTAARAYKRPMPAAEARRELARCAGTQFDPMIVRAFLNISLGKLRLAMGPLSWLAQLPFAQLLPQVGTAASTAASTAVATASTAAAMVLSGVVTPPKYAPVAAAAEETPEEVPRGDELPEPLAPAEAGPDEDPEPDTAAGAAAAPPRPPVASPDEATVLEDTPIVVDALRNDQPGDGALVPSTLTITRSPAAGTARPEGGGLIRFMPSPDRNGMDRFDYRICDEHDLCSETSVTVRVVAVNDPPVARSDTAMTREDVPVRIPVLANDSDVDGDPIVVTSAFARTGQVQVNSDGTLTYTPKKDWEGTDEVRYVISDGQGGTATGVVTVIVEGDNDEPLAAPDSATIDEDTVAVVDVLANDHDPDGDPLTVAGVSAPSNGTAAVAGGAVTYTPKKDWNGVDSFTYTIGDGRGGTATSTVTVTVKPVNDKPVAVDDKASVAEDDKVTVDVLANDTDPDIRTNGDVIKVTGASGATIGAVAVNADGTLLYTPREDAYGTETITYTIADREGATATGTLVITVTPVNDTPLADNVSADSGVDEPLVELTLVARDPKDEGRPGYPAAPIVAYEILTTPAAGILYYDSDDGPGESYVQAVAGVRTTNPVVKFTPPGGQSGSFSFTYRALDAGHPTPGKWTAPATGTFRVAESRLMVGLKADGSGAEGLRGATIHGLRHVFLSDHAAMASAAFWLDDPTMSGPPHSSDGSSRFDFNNGTAWNTDAIAPGRHTITARVTRTDGSTFVVSAPFTVVPNHAPVAVADAVGTDEDTAVEIHVVANDTDANGDPLTVVSVGSPGHGTATIKPGGVVRYKPADDWFGTDTFTYVIDDGHGKTATATVTVTVLPVPDAPRARPDTGEAIATTGSLVVDVLANDTDADDDLDPSTLKIVRDPFHGTAVVLPDRTVLYQADLLSGSGVDSFRYEICDATGLCARTEVKIGVDNLAPVTVADVIATSEDTAVTFDVVANDSDPNPWDSPLISSVTQPAQGTVTVDNDRKRVTYTPAPGWSGADTFTYTISDGLLSATGTVTVNVGAVNDAPVAVDDAVVTEVDRPVLIDVLANDTDEDPGDTITIASVGPPGSGTATAIGGKIEYEPAPGAFGTDSFDYTIVDSGGLTSTATVHVTINALPVAVDDTAEMDEDDGEISINVLANDFDPDNGTLSITGHGGATLGTVSVSGDHLHYTPHPHANGTDAFTYTISDGISTATGMVTVTINPVDDDPVAEDDDATTAKGVPVSVDVLANDHDPDGPILPGGTVTVTSGPSHGSVTVDGATGAITYTPNAGWSGNDNFNYTVCDATGRCDQAQVRVTVRTPPKAQDDVGSTSAGQSIHISVLANDEPGDAPPITSVTIVTAPTNGVAQVVGSNPIRIRYDPAPGFTGTDTFTYRITDAEGRTSTATVTVTVV